MNTIARPKLVRRGDHFVVAHRSAGLDHRRDAVLGGFFHAVGEREKRVGGEHRALQRQQAFIAPTFTESTRLICPAPTLTVWPARA